ncbi:MAG: hypothetical protein ABW095_15305 [Candidatus Thiodiazotropha sp.]
MAIDCDNREVIDYLCGDKSCLEYRPDIDKTLRKTVKQALLHSSANDALEQAEAFIEATFGAETPLERTPLLQACRYNNRYAIAKLLSAKADSSAKDIAGFTALDICRAVGGDDLFRFYIATCIEAGVRVTLSEKVIAHAIHDTGMLALLGDACKPGVVNHRLLLSAYCSLLDVAQVQQLLNSGIDVNKCMSPQYHPLFEACTSYLLWEWRHPRFPELAHAYTNAFGHPGGTVIQVDNDLIANAESLDDLGKLFGDAFGQQKAVQDSVRDSTLAPEVLEAQLRNRLEIIDLLLDAGLDPPTAEKKRPDLFVSRLVAMKQPELLQKLAAHGFTLEPADYEDVFLDEEERAYLIEWSSKPSADPLGA